MKNQAKLYKEYLKWVEQSNKPGLVKFKKEKDKERKEALKFTHSVFKVHMTAVERWESDWDKLVEAYAGLPFYKKLFSTPPNLVDHLIIRPTLPCLPPGHFFTVYVPKERESQGGFMKWLIDHKYKL